ncbi:hypothetical protein [uncultured Pontibacter sp.]|uniref:hypothetical protein n=1 Tax=uncultured Pontibacter sp. TaxID=453356 RepID=UPI00262263FA|nr:hypothetical protein [uncultured Pontibacter sp.]
MNIISKLVKSTMTALIAIMMAAPTFAQHHEAGGQALNQHTETHEFKHWRAGIMMYHTYIGTQTTAGKGMLIVPSLGLDLEYWFNDTWGIGSHNDLELISFEVERGRENFLRRETPLLFTLDALWKPWKGLVLLAGPGIEVEPHENLFVFRAGLEYEIEIGSHWDIAPTVFYDNRVDAYDTFSVGIGLGKRF